MAQIPAILQENNNDCEQNNLMTDHVHIDPLDAILIATKNVSAKPSDLRSIALETNDGYSISAANLMYFQMFYAPIMRSHITMTRKLRSKNQPRDEVVDFVDMGLHNKTTVVRSKLDRARRPSVYT
jgi:hypothetical protein